MDFPKLKATLLLFSQHPAFLFQSTDRSFKLDIWMYLCVKHLSPSPEYQRHEGWDFCLSFSLLQPQHLRPCLTNSNLLNKNAESMNKLGVANPFPPSVTEPAQKAG